MYIYIYIAREGISKYRSETSVSDAHCCLPLHSSIADIHVMCCPYCKYDHVKSCGPGGQNFKFHVKFHGIEAPDFVCLVKSHSSVGNMISHLVRNRTAVRHQILYFLESHNPRGPHFTARVTSCWTEGNWNSYSMWNLVALGH